MEENLGEYSAENLNVDIIPTGEEKALLPASHSKMNEEVNNVHDNEQSYEYFKHKATDNVDDSGPAFMVGKAIMGTMKAH